MNATVEHTHGISYAARKGNKVVCWFIQDGYKTGIGFTPENPDAVCVHTPSPHTDTQTDCFCDTWHHSIKSAVSALA